MDGLISKPFQNPAINVVYTTPEGTTAALTAAYSLSRGLEIRVRVLVFKVVPYQVELMDPTVSTTIVLRRILSELTTATQNAEFTVQYVLCRDQDDALVRSLDRDSLVVIGGRRGFVTSREERIARKLAGIGHEVVFVPTNAAQGRESWTHRCRNFVFRYVLR